MNNYVITIGRQVGSGGSVLGKAIAEYFNFSYIDKELLKEAAEELHISEEDLEHLDEKEFRAGRSLFQSGVYTLPYMTDAWNVPTGANIYQIESELIRQAAEEGPCVIVGRCGSDLFRGYKKHVSFFLHADEDERLERLEKDLDFPHEKSIKMIEKADKARARYYNTYTGRKWLDLTGYDLCIDTGKLDDEKVKEIAINYICTRFPELKNRL
ncbi:cytidylate kinase-like family protein [Anaerovorax odorimutans]|uniref:Cytidylate kinase-like family protein n=1 Tax=Anaerovorax odorimutans TaxID=109327 RepID=A0ABT1RM10_9FIRM|nr:cytidylate kinase-like family protein [Anaerovorax odorimutans]MCQ4636229.1 cytidylate kinase-like family protein [Anaerovorax odorimutans]